MLFSWLPHFNRRPFCEEATVSPFIYFARDRNGWGDPVLMLKVKCVFLGEIVLQKCDKMSHWDPINEVGKLLLSLARII